MDSDALCSMCRSLVAFEVRDRLDEEGDSVPAVRARCACGAYWLKPWTLWGLLEHPQPDFVATR